MNQQNKPIEPVQAAEWKAMSFEEWFLMAQDHNPDLDDYDMDFCDLAWHARDPEVLALVAALKKAKEALEDLEWASFIAETEVACCPSCEATWRSGKGHHLNCSIKPALSAITPLLKEKENAKGN